MTVSDPRITELAEELAEALVSMTPDIELDGPPQLNFNLEGDLPDFFIELENAVVTGDVAGVMLRVHSEGFTWLVEGSSKRGPEDKTDHDLGYVLAMTRALTSVTRQFERQAAGRIKNNDWIREEHQKLLKQKSESVDLFDSRKKK